MRGPWGCMRNLKEGRPPHFSHEAVPSGSLVPSLFGFNPSTSLAAGSEDGQDINPDESEVPFSVVERTSPSQDGASWSLTVQLDEEAQANGTTIAITTQICLNSGVCNPPEIMDSTVEEGT